MNASEIREFTDAEIQARLIEDEQLLQRMLFNHAISEVESPAKIRSLKKVIARIKTIQRERDMATLEPQNQ